MKMVQKEQDLWLKVEYRVLQNTRPLNIILLVFFFFKMLAFYEIYKTNFVFCLKRCFKTKHSPIDGFPHFEHQQTPTISQFFKFFSLTKAIYMAYQKQNSQLFQNVWIISLVIFLTETFILWILKHKFNKFSTYS